MYVLRAAAGARRATGPAEKPARSGPGRGKMGGRYPEPPPLPMTHTRPPRSARAALGAALLLLGGCGLRVTNEPVPYAQLDAPEKAAVDIIYDELAALDAQVRARSVAMLGREVSLSPLVDKDRILVDFEGMLFSFNFGDGLLRMATWENISDAQRALVASWFGGGARAGETRARYEAFIYRYMALAHGMKQYMYNLDSVDNVYEHKYILSMELDSSRAVHAYLSQAGRREQMWAEVARDCAPILARADLQAAYADLFSPAQSEAEPLRFPEAKRVLQDRWRELADPEDPSGYMYFFCQAAQLGQAEATSFDLELLAIAEDLAW